MSEPDRTAQLKETIGFADLTPRELEDILDPAEEVADPLEPTGYAALRRPVKRRQAGALQNAPRYRSRLCGARCRPAPRP